MSDATPHEGADPAAQPVEDQAPTLPEAVDSASSPFVPDGVSAQPTDASAPPAESGGTEAAPPPSDVLPSGPAVIARYGVLRSLGLFCHDLEGPLRPGTKVAVRSERGLELAEVVANIADAPSLGCLTCQQLADHLRAAGPEYPFYRNGRVLRLANTQDLIDQRHLANSAREEALYCRKQIRELNLDMKLVTVEHLLGGERIIFYFSAENRVDFRELVRLLAGQFRTRIEMRQVGARDEARLVGDFERCGRPCCCQSFLKDLKPISMRMAKMQKATLDPSKISGRCGRLMCCLRYEDAGYEELRARLPRKNCYVCTAGGVVGKVVDMQILTQLVRLLLPDNSQVVVTNEEITDRNVSPPPPGPQPRPTEYPHPLTPRPSEVTEPRTTEVPATSEVDDSDEIRPDVPEVPQELKGEPAKVFDQATGNEEPAAVVPQASPGELPQAPSGKSRRRRRRRRHGRWQGESPPASGREGQVQLPVQTTRQAESPPQKGQAAAGSRRRQRRRRGR